MQCDIYVYCSVVSLSLSVHIIQELKGKYIRSQCYQIFNTRL